MPRLKRKAFSRASPLSWREAAAGGRLGTLDATDVDRMAREFDLAGDELMKLSRSGAHASELLHRMMRANGLSYEELR